MRDANAKIAWLQNKKKNAKEIADKLITMRQNLDLRYYKDADERTRIQEELEKTGYTY